MKSFKEYSISPLSKGTRKHIDRVRDANDERLRKLRAAKRKKNPSFMDKLKKGFRKEENQINELSRDTIKRYHKKADRDAINALGSKDPKTKKRFGKRLTGMGKAYKRLQREEIEEARKPSDDNFGGAGHSGEKGFKNKAVASRGGQTAGRNRGRAAQRKAQQGMIDAAIKQDKKEFRKHAVAMSKSMSSMTRKPHPIQNMWTKEKAKAMKDGTWFKMSIAQQKKIEGNKPRFEPFDWSKMEGVSEAVSPAQQAAIAIAKKESGKYDKDGKKLKEEDPCWNGYKQVGTKMKNGKVVPNCVKEETEELEEAEYKGRKVTLNNPSRSNDGKKKFYVYVKNDKGNIIKLGFGDPNMEIKRDDPARRKSFRARHGCDNPGPKWKAKYWSCYQWRASHKVDN